MKNWLAKKLNAISDSRDPDFKVIGASGVYLNRWFVIPRNPVFNIYLHMFLRSDDDRALHDHPWSNLSYLVKGSYTEHTISQGGIHQKTVLKEGALRFRPSGKFAHRVELHDGHCITLFITGPRYRNWGFHCVHKGWVRWQDFTKPGAKGETGRGCD